MATSANLPAGFSITTISGVRCTAVPRTATTISGSAATAASSSSAQNSPNVQTTVSATSTAAQTTSSSVAQTTSSSVAVSSSSSSSTAETTTSSSSTTPAVVASTTSNAAPAVANTSQSPDTSTFQSSITSIAVTTSAQAASSSTDTPTTTTAPVALSDTLPSSSSLVSSSTHDPALHSSSKASAQTATQGAAAASSGISSTTSTIGSTTTSTSEAQSKAGPIAGSVVGGVAGLALIGFLIWFFLRRRNQRRRSTLLTPLGTGRGSEFYGINRQSVGSTKTNERWPAEAGSPFQKVGYVFSGVKEKVAILGSSLKAKVIGPRSDTPSVNLNRGQSQFMDGAIPQHSRTNSAASASMQGRLPVKDRFGDWLERFKEKAAFGRLGDKAKEPEDPFAKARGITEKQATLNEKPDFSQLLNMNDRELQLQAERRRASLARGDSGAFSSLGIDFTSRLDPFADPGNPFADPLTQPEPSLSKQNYVTDVRRSRGQSTDMSNQPTGTGLGTGAGWRPPSTAPASRYPSTIVASRDSYRDTVYSAFTTNTRKGRRSDPFDLERPELWRTPPPMPTQTPGGLSTINSQESESILATMDRGSAIPDALSVTRSPRVESSGTYESKYSSGMSFGDPGPDVGPGSAPGSLRNNGLNDYANDLTRAPSNASSVSSKGGVGKAR
ncbi:hypothetical protein BP6252_09334 [Coleophoma cylindrospora]|uniref:Epidermal growth factor receptor-like transmembrane-juxtamembrane segment domain-containing protein n=1 Tax=Coleophoma cylindrospora TaxID=1849047 RepID=A0A3D8R1V5_9HELO|nr:hypothetical protein BP6252_09334 [Coleophoma cylindrospora]